jgi:succinoglycan biosynthesis protein ExoM
MATVSSVRAARGHVSVCVCTYKRPELLSRLLTALGAQDTQGLCTFSIVVVDNDQLESGRLVVSQFARAAAMPVSYWVEPRRNIALARNKSVDKASGDFVAFIDDDEEPPPDWLRRLIVAIESYQADGVLGPIVPRFRSPPAEWIVRGGFFARPSPPSGTWLRWNQTRTGNALLRGAVFADAGHRFLPQYAAGGEDREFFRRMIAKGMRFVWCAEAAVSEVIPVERCCRSYLLKRALRSGRAPYNQEALPVATSLLAAPLYALALPVLLVFGQHVFMRYLIKECDHLGRILALFGAQPRMAE